MRVLLTGASGFLGRHVIAELAGRQIETFALGRAAPVGLPASRFALLPDPTDLDAISAVLRDVWPDAILHLAGTREAADLAKVNQVFAAQLLLAARASVLCPVVVLVGSAAEYGEVPASVLPVDENFPPNPLTPYGQTKLAQTRLGLAASAEGQPVIVARLFNIVGALMPEHLALGSFAAQIRRMGAQGGTLVTGDLDVARDFILAETAARILVELAFLPEALGEVVNICSGQPTSLRDLTMRLIATSGKPVRVLTDEARNQPMSQRVHYGSARKLRALGIEIPGVDAARMAALLLQGA